MNLLKKAVEQAAILAGAGLEHASLSLCFLSSRQMAVVNGQFLNHSGDTDVICFDYRTAGLPDDDPDSPVQVEIIVCPEVAAREAAKRSLPYSREVMLYVAHGLLHSAGFDDLKPVLKRRMRRAEHRVMSQLETQFNLSDIFPEPMQESNNTPS